MWWTALLQPLAGLGKSWIEGRQLKAKAKYNIELFRLKAEIERAKSLAKAEAEYDNYAQIAMKTSWKDEYLVLVISFPFIISFGTPFISVFFGVDLTPQLAKAWQLVGAAPEWYQYIFMGIVVATFGLRWMVKGRLNKFVPEKKKGIVKLTESE